MAQYAYKAIDENGKTVSGELEAENTDAAGEALTARGYIPTTITLKKDKTGASNGIARYLGDSLTPVKAPDLIIFTKQLRTMIRAGISIMNLLEILESQTENPRLKKTIARMSRDIREGATLHEAFSKHPGVFSPLYCSMIYAGEASGSLSDVLERLIYIIGHEHKVKSDIKSAMNYPIIVVVFLTIAFFVLLTFVIPKFVPLFQDANIDIPLPTRICIFLNEFLVAYWPLLLAGIVGGITALLLWFKTPGGRLARDSFLLRIPIIGQLMVKSAMSRFASIFAILQTSGVQVLDSMRILSGTIGNAAISKTFENVQGQLEEGLGLAGPLRQARFFTPMVINMIAIGEESGNLDEMLSEISIHYDSEVEYAIERLSAAIGPILIVGLAGVVGFFALAIFLPMWDLTKMV